MFGGSGDDLLAGGELTPAPTDAELRTLLTEWNYNTMPPGPPTPHNTITERMNAVDAAVGGGGLAASVSDSDMDALTGGLDGDWIIHGGDDSYIDYLTAMGRTDSGRAVMSECNAHAESRRRRG